MTVLDLLMLALLAAAFAGAVGYIHACVDLTRPAGDGAERHR
jgi:hypothetical protein